MVTGTWSTFPLTTARPPTPPSPPSLCPVTYSHSVWMALLLESEQRGPDHGLPASIKDFGQNHEPRLQGYRCDPMMAVSAAFCRVKMDAFYNEQIMPSHLDNNQQQWYRTRSLRKYHSSIRSLISQRPKEKGAPSSRIGRSTSEPERPSLTKDRTDTMVSQKGCHGETGGHGEWLIRLHPVREWGRTTTFKNKTRAIFKTFEGSRVCFKR